MMYAGRIAIVDLTDGTVSERATASYADRFLGGRGINAALLLDLATPGCDPLGPGNALIFGAGALCGMQGPGGHDTPFSRVEVTAKSPETGLLGSANMGGAFGLKLKRAGFDHLAVRGVAATPVFVSIDDGVVAVHDASALWGLDTLETQRILKERYGDAAEVACIGPAGERLVRFASVRHGDGHAATRTGLGCVMGAKHLKAVVVRGQAPVTFADPDRCSAAVGDLYDAMKRRWWHQEIVLHGLTRMVDEYKHWWATDDNPPDTIKLLRNQHRPQRTGCHACATPCMERYETGTSRTVVTCAYYIYPTYAVRNRDPQVLLDCTDYVQRNGLDIVSVMTMISWLMDLQERGLISAADTDGIEMRWGDRHAILGMLERIVRREGIGDVLANGMRAAARHFGHNSGRYANEVKGLPFYGIANPDIVIGSKDVALGLVTSTRGDTMRSYVPAETLDNLRDAAVEGGLEAYARQVHQPPEKVSLTAGTFRKTAYEGKPEQALLGEDLIVINDMLGVCKLQSWHLGNIDNERLQALLLSQASGVETDAEQLIATARRVIHVERAFNVREGLRAAADTLPPRLFESVAGEGSRFSGQTLDAARHEDMKRRYYRLRGWDPISGVPELATLRDAGLEDVIGHLAGAGVPLGPGCDGARSDRSPEASDEPG